MNSAVGIIVVGGTRIWETNRQTYKRYGLWSGGGKRMPCGRIILKSIRLPARALQYGLWHALGGGGNNK